MAELKFGISLPELLLPTKHIDLNKWAVIACDQFTSQPEYWQAVEDLVGNSPSTLRMILPEVYLSKNEEEETQRIHNTIQSMQNYLREGVFESRTGMVFVERTINGHTRQGLVVCLDLEAYDFRITAQTLVRASEGTIIERIPPRVRIRKDAPIETSHILVLYDDPEDTVLSEVKQEKTTLPVCYDFDLMMGSGSIIGRLVNEPRLILSIYTALANLADGDNFCHKYDLPEGIKPLLFAVGDGNHSLATAKTIWEQLKPFVGMDHPARYALVEIINLHDPAMEFEPIHRVLYNAPDNLIALMKDHFGDDFELITVKDLTDLTSHVNQTKNSEQFCGLITSKGYFIARFTSTTSNLTVGTLQPFLDKLCKDDPGVKIDYIHGKDVLEKIALGKGNAGFFLPAIEKNQFFNTVIRDGAFPRKTFSMGEANEKRFYLECRKIK